MHALAPLHPQKIALISASILLCLSAFPAQAEEIAVTPQPPDILLGPLFNDVQNAKLFPDQKTFADAVPNSDPLMILADYRMQQNPSCCCCFPNCRCWNNWLAASPVVVHRNELIP